MRRRALLSLSALALGGCVAPGSGEIGVSTATSDCPPVGDRIVCVPETDPGGEPVALTTDSRSVSPPATMTLTLENGAGEPLSTNFYAWKLWKRVAGEWVRIVPDIWVQPLMVLDSGEHHTWALTAEHDLPANPGRYYDAWQSEGTVGGLGGGEYAFATDGFLGESDARMLGFAARFSVDAPDLTLDPTARVTDASRDDDVVTVRGEGIGEDAQRAEFVLRRVGDADDPQRVLPEQAAHDYRLRNTLSYFEDGVERVRYVEQNHAISPAFGAGEPYTICYRGELYEASAKELGAA